MTDVEQSGRAFDQTPKQNPPGGAALTEKTRNVTGNGSPMNRMMTGPWVTHRSI